jgi:hypothetical protein
MVEVNEASKLVAQAQGLLKGTNGYDPDDERAIAKAVELLEEALVKLTDAI